MIKTSKLLVVGTVAFDSIETPFGKVDRTLGGSASFFSLAASFFSKTSLVGVIGKDFPNAYKSILAKKNIDLSGLEQTSGETFSWGGKYSFDLNSRETLFTKLGVLETFKPKLSELHKASDFVFLGNAHPSLQLEVLGQIKKPKFVGLDTMNLWIEIAPKELQGVLKKIDIFIINDSEARQFSKEHNILKAAKKIMGMMAKNKTLIIKRGEYGLLMFRAVSPSPSLSAEALAKVDGRRARDEGSMQIFNLPGFPLEDVVDPTGAGDSFAGGMFGYLAKTGNTTWENLKRACVAGSTLASFSVEKLGTKKLEQINSTNITERLSEFKKLTDF